MSEKQLRAMLAYASHFCEREFARNGVVYPMWHATTSKGETIIETPASPDKDASVALIRALFEIRDVVRYVFFDEAWTLLKCVQPDEMVRIDRDGLRNHPERVEVVMFQGEDAEWGGQISAHRLIHRPASGKPYLGPFVTLDELAHLPHGAVVQSEGRLVGLLPMRGTKQ